MVCVDIYICIYMCVCVVHNNNKQVWKSPVVSLLLGLEGIKMTLRIKKQQINGLPS